jgi:hypothetical protein
MKKLLSVAIIIISSSMAIFISTSTYAACYDAFGGEIACGSTDTTLIVPTQNNTNVSSTTTTTTTTPPALDSNNIL